MVIKIHIGLYHNASNSGYFFDFSFHVFGISKGAVGFCCYERITRNALKTLSLDFSLSLGRQQTSLLLDHSKNAFSSLSYNGSCGFL